MPQDPSGLRVVPDADGLAYQRLVVVIEATRADAAALQAEIETLRDDLGRFEQTYHARTGHLFAELNRLRLACDEFRHRIALRRATTAAPTDEIEGDVERVFRHRRQTVDDEAEEAAAYRRRADDGAPELSPSDDEELRQTYRDLARRTHPDLTRDPAERRRREERMVRINTAYRDRDLDALRALLAMSSPDDDPADRGRTAADRLTWATAELRRLDGVVAALRGDLAIIRDSPSHALRERTRRDPELLDDMAVQVAAQITEAQARLTDLETTYRTLLGDG